MITEWISVLAKQPRYDDPWGIGGTEFAQHFLRAYRLDPDRYRMYRDVIACSRSMSVTFPKGSLARAAGEDEFDKILKKVTYRHLLQLRVEGQLGGDIESLMHCEGSYEIFMRLIEETERPFFVYNLGEAFYHKSMSQKRFVEFCLFQRIQRWKVFISSSGDSNVFSMTVRHKRLRFAHIVISLGCHV